MTSKWCGSTGEFMAPLELVKQSPRERFMLYELRDPLTTRARYVGYTKAIRQRYTAHCCPGDARTHKATWIRQLITLGLKPILRVLCIVGDVEEAKRLEIAWIDRLKLRGERLTNGTTGGDGSHGNRSRLGRPHSAETISRMRAKAVGRRNSPDARAKMRVAHLGVRRSVEHRARISAGQRGRHFSVETRAKIGLAHRGKVISSETKRRIAAATRKRWADVGYRNRHRVAMSAPEVIEACRMAALKRWRRRP